MLTSCDLATSPEKEGTRRALVCLSDPQQTQWRSQPLIAQCKSSLEAQLTFKTKTSPDRKRKFNSPYEKESINEFDDCLICCLK